MLFPLGQRPQIVNAELSFVYDYWNSKRTSLGRLPSRSHVDPVEIASLRPTALPHIWLLDVVRPEVRFRYRLIGGALDNANVKARIGDFVDQFEDADAKDSFHNELRRMCLQLEVSHRIGPPRLPHSSFVRSNERISLPLSGNGATVDMILNATAYGWMENAVQEGLSGFTVR